jgi:hypothetical protein
MRTRWTKCLALTGLLAVALGLVAGTGTTAPAPPSTGTWIVHEWGTFLSLQGSDGVNVGGIVDSEEELPWFVREQELDGHSRGGMFQKMETPVTYFYTDRPRDVQVRVDMPRGQLTHWYPAVRAFTPKQSPKPSEKSPAPVLGSSLDWGTFQVVPDTRFLPSSKVATPALKPNDRYYGVEPASTWRFARETDAALVRVRSGNLDFVEKFLFYRGVGSFELPLQVHSLGTNEQLHLTLRNRGEHALQGLFLVWVDQGTIRFGALDDMPGGATLEVGPQSTMTQKLPLADGVPSVKEQVAEALTHAGLYAKEAQAMVNTWERSYFRTDGLRVLSVLPRANVDAVIPIQIAPAPDQLVRVMVGRIEVLTPDMERRLEQTVADLDAKDAKVREAANADLARFGRMREPVLRRLIALTQVPEVRTRAETLIAKIAAPKKGNAEK